MAATVRPVIVVLEKDDLDRLMLIAQFRGRGITAADLAAHLIRTWLAGPGQHELAEAADRFAGPRIAG